MTMSLLLIAVMIWLVGGCLALVSARSPRLVSTLTPAAVVAGCVLAAIEAVKVLASGEATGIEFAWPIPLGNLSLGMDPLSAFFVLPVALVCGLAAIYGSEYLLAYRDKKRLGAAWFYFCLLTASMVVVVTARNGLLFLIAWELMSLVSFFLVMFEDEAESSQRAGWTYLVASHLGTAFLLALFVLLPQGAGSLEFARIAVPPELAGAAFLLAVIGFGTKAGFVPLHVWLPESHPAAPSHVSAVMSGVMIKMGIYGLLRTLTFLGPMPAWWGWLLVAIGASSGILGVLWALAQQDLKRLLAYHSVENIGIIALGLGVGLLGISYNRPEMAALGFAGGLLHVWNHALFKSLLFLGAGSVAHAAGTREIEHLGGLLKRMPVTGTTFLVGAAAISGLPPLNGFVSELLVYLGGFSGLWAAHTTFAAAIGGLLVIGSLALIGGLAAACFAKAFGVVFLGEPRSEHAQAAHEPGRAICLPLIALAAACGLVGIFGPFMPKLVAPVVATVLPAAWSGTAPSGLDLASKSLAGVCYGSLALVTIIALLAWLRTRLLAARPVTEAVTWDCGYAAPSPRMQYTASSFAQPLLKVFQLFVRTKTKLRTPEGLFPDRAALHTEAPDVFRERLFAPLFSAVRWVALRLHRLQEGRIQLYVLYIAMTLLVLLVWKLG
jgi:formate hydrogenlyase subunit 3/multisubunit Na+/H+ antiporter MnhD subunit